MEKYVLNILMENVDGTKFVTTDEVSPSDDPNFIAIVEEKLKYNITGELTKDHRHQALLCVAMIDEFDELLCPDDILDIITDPVVEDMMTEAYSFNMGTELILEEDKNKSQWHNYKILDYSFECITEDNKFEVIPTYKTVEEDEDGGIVVEFEPKHSNQLELF